MLFEREIKGPAKKELRTEIMDEWQREWETETHGRWTYHLIPDIREWVKCNHKNLSYYTTQFLTGHGCFKTYTHRIGKEESEICAYCEEIDDIEHTFCKCRRWEEIRRDAHKEISFQNCKELLISMMTNRKMWRVGENMIKGILEIKEEEERKRQKQEQRMTR